MSYYSTSVTAVGEEVADLLDGGVLILYADGAPQALAEVSIQHQVQEEVPGFVPAVGHQIVLGPLTTRITAIGDTAWKKVKDLGHVVLSFNGSSVAERPGEICVEPIDADAVKTVVVKGCLIAFAK